MIFTPQGRAAVKEVEKHWKSNLIIRLVLLALDIAASVVFGLVPFFASFIVEYIWIALAPSIVWTLFVIVFRLIKVKPIHPGVHVGFELSIFLDLMVFQVLTYLQIWPRPPWEWEEYSAGDVGVFVAGMIVCLFLTVMCVLHFYLFVRACIETSRARSHEIATQAATMAAQIVKNMESRGTFYRRNSDLSYELRPFSSTSNFNSHEPSELRDEPRPRGGGVDSSGNGSGSGNSNTILGLEELRHNTGLAPMQFSSGMSTRTGRTMFSESRTQYSHTRSLSVPVPTSPMSLRTARTDEPSLFRLER